MALILKKKIVQDDVSVKIYYSPELEEYVVRLLNPSHYKPADYFTDDWIDALALQKRW